MRGARVPVAKVSAYVELSYGSNLQQHMTLNVTVSLQGQTERHILKEESGNRWRREEVLRQERKQMA